MRSSSRTPQAPTTCWAATACARSGRHGWPATSAAHPPLPVACASVRWCSADHKEETQMRRTITTGLLVLACATISTVPADATFPDQNGRIAFRRFLDVDQTTGAIFTVDPDGTDELQVTHPPAGVTDRNPD